MLELVREAYSEYLQLYGVTLSVADVISSVACAVITYKGWINQSPSNLRGAVRAGLLTCCVFTSSVLVAIWYMGPLILLERTRGELKTKTDELDGLKKSISDAAFRKEDFSFEMAAKSVESRYELKVGIINHNKRRTVTNYNAVVKVPGCSLESLYFQEQTWVRQDDSSEMAVFSQGRFALNPESGISFVKLKLTCQKYPPKIPAEATLSIADTPQFEYKLHVNVAQKTKADP